MTGPLAPYAAIRGGVARIGASCRAGDRRADHRRHRLGSRPRRAADARRRQQARLHQPASDPEARHLRSRADARPAAAADGGDRGSTRSSHGIEVYLVAALQPAGRRDRSSMAPLARLAHHLAAPPSAGDDLAGAHRDDDGRAAGRARLSRKGLAPCMRCRHALGGLKVAERCITAR